MGSVGSDGSGPVGILKADSSFGFEGSPSASAKAAKKGLPPVKAGGSMGASTDRAKPADSARAAGATGAATDRRGSVAPGKTPPKAAKK